MWIDHDEEETPRFAILKEICVFEKHVDKIFFVTEALHTQSFNKHFNAYEVSHATELRLVKQQQLSYYLPLHLITVTDQGQIKTLVCTKYQIPIV